jgi:hypothetical protein
MFKNLYIYLMKKLYSLFIVKIVILDRNENKWIDKLELFAKIDVQTDKGDFVFLFKRDRRQSKNNSMPIKTYITELDIPDTVTLKNTAIADKFVVVIKVALFEVCPEILSKLLMDIYLTAFLKND